MVDIMLHVPQLYTHTPSPLLVALVFYDYVITLDHEINLFWKRKFTGATILFLLNRYLLVLFYIIDIASTEHSSDIVRWPYSLDCVASKLTSSTCANRRRKHFFAFGPED